MILIDTSVWIEFFKQRVPFKVTVQYLLKSQKAMSIEPVFAELFYGVRNQKEKDIIQSYWQILPRIKFGQDSMIKAAEFANSSNFLQSGIGLMDAIIIQNVMEGNHLLWTLDKRILRGIGTKIYLSTLICPAISSL